MKPTAFLLAGALALTACANGAGRDRSHLVTIGPKRSYYVVEPGSPLQDELGLGRAPVSDTASPLRAGHGTDVIALRFNRAGVLAAPPVYLAQLGPEADLSRRLAVMVQGKTTWAEAEHLFTAGNQKIRQPDGGLLVYHEIPVYNPLEERPGGAR